MALTATYNGDLSRIRLAGASLGASTYAVFDRTLNGITYTTVRGGSAVPVTASAAHLDDYEFPVGVTITYRVRSYNASNVLQATFTTTINQDLVSPWLKSVSRTYLNQEISAADASDVVHANRSHVFPVVGRSNGVAVTDVSSGLSYDLMVATLITGDADDLRYMVTSGDILFLHVPAGFPRPGGYYTVGDVTEADQNLPWERRWFTLPLTRVAQPGPDIVATSYTIASLLFEYATITAVIADNPTIADMLDRVGSSSEVVVP